MAKIVSEKREIITPNLTPAAVDKEPSNSPLVTALGVALTAVFLLGAVAMVVLAFKTGTS